MFYKVCCRGQYYAVEHLNATDWISASQASEMPINARVIYKIGRWTVPRIKKSKLFVFRNFDHAKAFRQEMKEAAGWFSAEIEVAVFEIECANPEPVPNDVIAECDYIHQFWDKYQEMKETIAKSTDIFRELHRLFGFWPARCPKASYWCDRVKLVKRV